MSNLQELLEHLSRPPIRPAFRVPSLTHAVYSAFDVAQVAGVAMQSLETGEISEWCLLEHREGYRALIDKAPGQPYQAHVVMGSGWKNAAEHFFEGKVECPGCSPLLLGTSLQEATWSWGDLQAAPFIATAGRESWAERLVSGAATKFSSSNVASYSPALAQELSSLLSEADESVTRNYLFAPRAELIAHVVEEVAAGLQDGFADALSMGPMDLMRALSKGSLTAIAHSLQTSAGFDSEHEVLQLTPADVVYRSINPIRAMLLTRFAEKKLPPPDHFSRSPARPG